MTGATADRIDRLARWFASGRLRTDRHAPELSGERRLDRSSLLRAGALGIVAFSLRRVPSARAAGEVAAGCSGGSLKACYATVEKNFNKYVRTICDTLKDKKGDPFGTASYSCYVGWLDARLNARKDCRADCPKPKSPTGGKGGGGGGGGTPPPPSGGGRTPTCGHVDCVQGDKCCPNGPEPICCAICCARNGMGCGSSDSDC